MFEVTVNGTDKLPVKLVDATDRVTEETGITSPTVYYSKAGGAATALSTPTFTELSATNMPGIYLLTLTTAMTDTAGPLVVTVTKTGCAPASLVVDVKAARLTASDVWANATRTLSSFGTLTTDTATAVWAAGTRTLTSFGTLAADVWASATRTLTSLGAGSITSSTFAAGAITAAVIATDAIDADAIADDAINSGALASSAVAEIADAVWDEAQSGHVVAGTFGKYIDTEVSSRNATAPDNASITAIKAKTDNLPTDPADQSLVEAAITAAHATTDAAIAALPTAADAAIVKAILANKWVESADGATITVYDTDDTTPLGTFTWSESTKTRGRFQ